MQAEPEVTGPRQRLWFRRLGAEQGNLRAAWSWLLEHGEPDQQLAMSAALAQFLVLRGYESEGRRWLEAGLAQGTAQSPALRAKALITAAWLAWAGGDVANSTRFGDEGLVLARQLGDPAMMASALFNLGGVALYHGAYQRAQACYTECLALQRQLGDHGATAMSLLGLTHAMIAEGAYQRAGALGEECLAHAEAHGLTWATALGLNTLGQVALHQHEYDRAAALCTKSLAMLRDQQQTRSIAYALHILACLAAAQGRSRRAARLWGAAESLRETLGTSLGPLEQTQYAPFIDAAQTQLGTVQWAVVLAEGRAMALDPAIAYALGEMPHTGPDT
jgi:non-specific serine/threonine protein kinase